MLTGRVRSRRKSQDVASGRALRTFTGLLRPLTGSLGNVSHSLSLLTSLRLTGRFRPSPTGHRDRCTRVGTTMTTSTTTFRTLRGTQMRHRTVSPHKRRRLIGRGNTRRTTEVLTPIGTTLSTHKRSLGRRRGIHSSFPTLSHVRQHHGS